MTRALVLVDGEHYPPVVAAAIAGLGLDVAGALLIGGAEKLRAVPRAGDYGVPVLLTGSLGESIASTAADVVVDLSDEPVLSQRTRLALAAEALAAGASYRAGGLTLSAPVETPYPLPSIAVVGTGKRIGKTAISAHLARLAAELLAPGEVVAVGMGRGGPADPEVVEAGSATLADLLRRSRDGAHAASDFLELAVLGGVATIGARRCGSGLAGDVVHSNVPAAADLAAARGPALTVFDGSGAAFPPVRCSRTLLVVPARVDREELFGYLGPYRLRRADAVIVVGEAPDIVARLGCPAATCQLVVRPTVPVTGRRVAVFATSHRPEWQQALVALGAETVTVSGALAERSALAAAIAAVDADLLLTELKAAAIDVLAEEAGARGIELGFVDNVPVGADAILTGLVEQAVSL